MQHSDLLDPAGLRRDAVARAHGVVDKLTIPDGAALAATGSFARGEMSPYSDLDLILLLPEGEELDDAELQQLWYPVWDSPLHLDAAIRTPAECAALVSGDDRSGLALLDITHVAGDAELSRAARTQVLEQWRRTVMARFDQLADTAIRRWHRSGSLVTFTRPDLKYGRGGLRDLDFLRALALGNVADAPALEAERTLLIDVRTLLHTRSRRSTDILEPEFAADIADDLGYTDRYELTASVVAAGKRIDDALTAAFATARALSPRRGTGAEEATPLAFDVVGRAGRVNLARKPDVTDPTLTLRVAAAAARHGLTIAESTLQQLRHVPPLPERWPENAARDFFALLSSPAHTPRVIDELERHGLFSRIVPEWAHVRGRLPGEPSHVQTIDQHLLETASRCASARTQVARPDLLLLAAIFHDLGKGYGRPHEMVGAELVAKMAARLGLSLSDRVRVQTLVAEHTTLARLAARFDPADDQARDLLLDACNYDVLTVELLGVLAEADAQATGPGVYTRTLAHAIDVLTRRAHDALTNLEPHRPIVSAPGRIGLKRSRAAGLTVFWRGRDQKEAHRLLAVLRIKAWGLEAVRMTKKDSGVVAEFDVRPRAQSLQSAADERSFVQAVKSARITHLPPPEPGATFLHWHSGRMLEVRTVDRDGVLGAVLLAVPELAWLKGRILGGTSIITLSFAGDVDRAQVERNVTSAMGSR